MNNAKALRAIVLHFTYAYENLEQNKRAKLTVAVKEIGHFDFPSRKKKVPFFSQECS